MIVRLTKTNRIWGSLRSSNHYKIRVFVRELVHKFANSLLLTGVRLHPPGRTDKKLCRCFGAPARRGFPDHLIM